MGRDSSFHLGGLQDVSWAVCLDRAQSPKLAKGDDSRGFAAEVNYLEGPGITG